MIYFLQAGKGGDIKIGYSPNVRNRMKTLQTGNATPLILLGVTEGGVKEEHAAHRQFAFCRVSGEWFSPHKELLEWIKGNTTLPTEQEQLGSLRSSTLFNWPADGHLQEQLRSWAAQRGISLTQAMSEALHFGLYGYPASVDATMTIDGRIYKGILYCQDVAKLP